jgi:hypothetical protein
MEDRQKILQKYLNTNTSTARNRKNIQNNKYKNVKIIDELDDFKNDDAINKLNEGNNINSGIHWQEFEEDNEDELNAIANAKREVNIDEEEYSNKKRERHDSDSESGTEKELDELIKDEDGDIILEEDSTKKFKMEIKNKKLNHPNQKQQTVYRDEHGRKVDKSETKEAKKKKLEKLNYEQLKQWAMGFIQKEENKKMKQDFEKMKNEPLTRYDIDKQTEDDMRYKQRFGDPMKELIASKNIKRGESNDMANKRERGFYLPKCKFVAGVNRFGIEPGYRWDGVDRSTGFEKKYLESINLRNAREHEYHKLRTEEM